ncbi:MAG: DNA mismatch repair endonuclease MutL [Clostridia bacterium]|nr:DNA mismatch repair endonuclease MutL [Clostridia bacterium]
MGKIQLLDKHTAELIAAGEVVERPASVVKELVENAIDAGATNVTVEIERGGVGLIRVTDNGSGMEHEDVPMAFLRHATSKVRTADDLEAIGTLGFRGEALASVAEVARVELRTCRAEDMVGTHYVIEGGVELVYEDDGCAVGTTIYVRDLFYNIPARMKFLKKDVSEGNAVSALVSKLALSHPEIAMRLIRDGKEVLLTPGNGDLNGCVYAVLGKEFASTQIPVEYSLGGVHVYGSVCKVESGRPSRSLQHAFLNGRYVRSMTVQAALERAYHGLMMSGRYPTCVLFVDLPAETVDVNVHPTKLEVRFVNERPVFEAVYHGVRAAIDSSHTRKQAVLDSRPSAEQIRLGFAALETAATPKTTPLQDKIKAFTQQPKPSPAKPLASVVTVHDDGAYAAKWPTEPPKRPFTPDVPYSESVKPAVSEQVSTFTSKPNPPQSTPIAPAEKPPIRVVGEAFATYILAEMENSLYLIDKHAAHERVLYEKFKNAARADSQQLLTPIPVTLTGEEQTALLDAQTELSAAGYEVEEFGNTEVLVRAVPLLLAGDDVVATVREIAGGLLAGRHDVTTDRLDWLFHNTACRAATKGGDSSTPAERQALAERVLWDPSIRTCPHGRPVCVELTRRELEKQFGRIV